MQEPPSKVHDLVAACMHNGIVESYKRMGLHFPQYREGTYENYHDAVELLIKMFPQIANPGHGILPPSTDKTSSPTPGRHTHWSHVVMSPDGCIDRTSIHPETEDAWARANHGKFDPDTIAKMRKVGYKITRVRVEHDPI